MTKYWALSGTSQAKVYAQDLKEAGVIGEADFRILARLIMWQ